MYDRFGWWSEDEFVYLLRSAINPARFPYLRRTMTETLGVQADGARVLDVGCGGGLLAEEFAKLGCQVTGIDPSSPSLEAARAHADEFGLSIEYVRGSGEQLPFDDESFDVVYCCDVLEHVEPAPVVREIARVLKDEHGFMFDTHNRTLRSKLVMIKLFQEWDATRCVEPGLHDWAMFIRPTELERDLMAAGMRPGPMVGIAPKAPPPKVIRLLRQRRRGEIDYAQLGAGMKMRECRDKSVMYMGYATKTAPNAKTAA